MLKDGKGEGRVFVIGAGGSGDVDVESACVVVEDAVRICGSAVDGFQVVPDLLNVGAGEEEVKGRNSVRGLEDSRHDFVTVRVVPVKGL